MSKQVISTADPAGRPKRIERPVWHGTVLEQHPESPFLPTKDGPEKREIVLPPGISQSAFDAALSDLRGLLGPDFVKVNDIELVDGDYHAVPLSHDSYHILDPDDMVPSAVCWPGNTEQVSKVVKWANKHKIPIWPISIGRNLGYGGSAPRVRGSVILDLGRRMNRVLDVSVDNAACLVEPGVQYLALYEHLQNIGVGNKLWIDVPDLPGGSVMGNALDRGIGYTPHGDHWAQHCGLEVVLPDGDIVRTGMGAMPGSDCWQLFPYGFGPYHDGIFSQSNYGIVTKMGVWLMPNPGGLRPFMATFPSEDDHGNAVDALRPLMVQKVIGNVPCLRLGLQDATMDHKKTEFPLQSNGLLDRKASQKIIDKLGTGAWVFYAALYGPDEITQPKFDYIKRKLTEAVPGARFYERKDVAPTSYLHDYAKFTAGIPTWRELDRMQYIPNASHLFFAPISATSGKDAMTQADMCRRRMEQFGFDYLGTFFIGHREMHHVISFMYDRTNQEEKRRALACIRALIDDAAARGIGEYRTHLALQDQVAATYGWNNGAAMRLNNKIKDALDPNGILQPGRSGIWPKQYRGKNWEMWGGELRSHRRDQHL